MPSRQGSVSLHSLDSPPSQTRLTYPLVPSTMHDHPLDYQSDRYSVDPYGVVPAPSSTGSPPYDYTQPPAGVGALMSAGPARPKRKQVKNACSACQRACKRCDVGRPCERCIKYGMQDSCRDSQRKERKKGVKRGPYKKRDGMLNDLQRMSSMPTKTRTSRVSSISDAPSQPSTSSISQMDQTSAPNVPLYLQQVPTARQSEGSFSYQTTLMIPASTQHPSLASMHPSSSHANMHHSGRGEDQYYQPRYDQLAHGSASARPSHYRMDSYSVQQQQQPQQDYDTKQHVQILDHRSMRAIQYPASDESPSRERHYSSQIYNDNPPRHTMIQTSPGHQDVPYQSQPDPVHDSPGAVGAQYSYATQQQQRSYERTYQDRSFQERSYQDRSYQDRSYQDRSYANEVHMQDTTAQQEIQQPQQQQYYSSYNTYQNQPSSSYNSQSQSYGYSQNHASTHSMATAQHVSDQTDSGYMGRGAADQVSYGSSINSYPTQQQHQTYPSQNSMGAAVQYSMRPSGRVMHRDMVAHPHVGNVSIQSN